MVIREAVVAAILSRKKPWSWKCRMLVCYFKSLQHLRERRRQRRISFCVQRNICRNRGFAIEQMDRLDPSTFKRMFHVDTSWEKFKITLNQFGPLQWNVKELTTSTTFLDFQINIMNGQLHTKTYQKALNLYLYIPPISAHPQSCFKGLITGELIRYWKQNSDQKDFINVTQLFIQRLVQRGYKVNDIIPTLRSTAATIDNIQGNRSTLLTNSPAENTLYIHW